MMPGCQLASRARTSWSFVDSLGGIEVIDRDAQFSFRNRDIVREVFPMDPKRSSCEDA